MTNEYEVGYGKPPKKHQFKPGYSGNKKGRPKGSPNINTMVNEISCERISIYQNGKKKKIPKREAVFRKLELDAVSGEPKARNKYLDMCMNAEKNAAELEQRKEFIRQDDTKLLEEALKEFSKGETLNE